jgi:hypothetical protein
LDRHIERVPEVGPGLIPLANVDARPSEEAMSGALRRQIGQAAGGGDGGDVLMPVTLPVEKVGQRPGQLPGVGVPAVGGGVVDGAEILWLRQRGITFRSGPGGNRGSRSGDGQSR